MKRTVGFANYKSHGTIYSIVLFIVIAVSPQSTFIFANKINSLGIAFAGDSGANAANCPEIDAPAEPWVILGKSVECRPILAAIRGEGKDIVLLLGAFHGTERLTGALIEQLDREMLSKPGSIKPGRRVVVVPYVNPDGYAHQMRTNAHGVDINRNFPTRNWRQEPTFEAFPPGPYPASEPETQAIMKLIASNRPTLIITVHSPLKMINFDGPARSLARRMSRISGLRLKSHIGYSTPGSLGTYAGDERKIPTITLELPEAESLDSIWEPMSKALLYAINH